MFKYTMITLFFIICISFYYIQRNSDTEKFSCESVSEVSHAGLKIHMRYNISIGNGSGNIRMNGSFDDKGYKTPISRQIAFSYKTINNEYSLKSEHILIFSNDQGTSNQFNMHFPDFFYKENKFVNFKILDDKYKNKIFIIDDVPILYCDIHR